MKLLTKAAIAVAVAIGTCSFPSEAKIKKVDVKPGTLHRLVKDSDFKDNDALTITGILNNSDIIVLRELCGRDTVGNETPVRVRKVDMRDVTFENSGAPYFLKLGSTYSASSAHTMPPCLFYDTAIEELVLPAQLDSVGDFALNTTLLRELKFPKHIVLGNAAVANDSLLEVLHLPDIKGVDPVFSPIRNYLNNLKQIKYSDTDYVMSGSFRDGMEEIEEIVFDGMIGHIDGYQISNCPNLKRVIFNGPIFSTGGMNFAQNCPNLEEIQFNSLVVNLGLVDNPDCPKLEKLTINGAIINSSDTIAAPSTPISEIMSRPGMPEALHRIAEWEIAHMGNKDWLGKMSRINGRDMVEILKEANMMELAEQMNSAYEANRDPDEGKTKLQILKESAPYKAVADRNAIKWTVSYADPSDSLLTRTREYFNLDSVAGDGDDISRIKNLLYWVHDLVRHDGGSNWPSCHFNLVDLYETAKKEERGYNCRFMAMMLAEALLAEGIPARYLTCQPKAYDDDPDCHVITMAWSDSLGKWIWVDPTFAAYVTDENGLLLHPGEVRYRLQNDLPLVLNEDANWNHESNETKEHYLDYYMAKNLYVISCNLMQQSEPEGTTNHPKGKSVALIPEGFDFINANILLTDDEIFWAAPTKK